MNFPLVNISAENWTSHEIVDILFDEFIYTDNETIFNKYYKNQKFTDCNGHIYTIIGKAELTENWRIWLRFIPNVWKRKINFQSTGKSISVEELRFYLLKRVSELEKNAHTDKWMEELKTAKSLSELINGL